MSRVSLDILKRYLILFAGLSVMAFGVAFSIKANLGTSPISSVPYVVSLFALLTVGTATIWQQWFICLTGILLVAVGVREGTVAAALLVGLIAKRIGKVLQK